MGRGGSPASWLFDACAPSPLIPMSPADTANIEVLDLLEHKVNTALANKRIKAADKTLLEMQQLFILYLREDHKKVIAMWAVFRPMAWTMGIAAATLITLFVSGKVQILIK